MVREVKGMTKSLKKVLVILVSALILSTCGMFLTVNNGINPASAAEPTEFYMLEEAWLKSTSEGLRFKAYVDKDTGDSIIAGEKKLVFIVAPEDIFAGATSDFKDIAGVKEIEAEPSKLYESDGGYLANVAINNIKPKNRDRAFQAVAAIVEDGVYTYAKSTPSSEEVGPCVDRELYGAVNQAVLAEDTDAESINTLLANYEWFGKTESVENEVVSYPVVVETREQYKSYVNKVVIEKQNDESAIITLPVVYDEVIDDAVKEEVIQEVVDETGEDVQSFVDEVTEALPAVFKVTFVTDAGSNVVSVIEGSVLGNKVDALAGFTFDGWYKDDVAFDLNTEIAEDITLVAKYSKTLEKADYEAFGSVSNGAPVANVAALFNAGETIVSVSAVKDEEEFTAFVNNGTTVTLNVSGGFYGEITFTVATATKTYTVPVNVITKVIRSQADLENMLIYGGIDTSTTEKNYGGYFVLGNNINLNGALANRVANTDYRHYVGTEDNGIEDRDGKTPNAGKNGFTGIFDGQGYTISGFKAIPNNGGIFGNVSSGATVKNLGVVGQFAQAGFTFVLANQIQGTVDNVYVEMSYADGLATGNYSLLARSTANATLKNIVVKANAETVVGKTRVAYMPNDWYGWGSHMPTITNVYAIGSTISAGYGDNTTFTGVFAYDEVASVTLADSAKWDLTGDQPAYVSAPVEINYNNDVEVYSSVSNGSPVVGSLEFAVTANSIKSVKVGGNAISYTYNEGLVTINNTELSAYLGTNVTIIVETDVRFYIYNLPVIYTKVIKTQTDLENIMIYGGIDANKNYGGYFALGCNIAVSGVLANRVAGTNYVNNVTSTSTITQGFTGTFDGQGYTISGVQINGANGAIFGNVANGAVVKNLGVTATFAQVASGHTFVFGAEFAGELKNSYVEVDFAEGSGGANYSVIGGQVTNAMFNDVVIKLDAFNISGGSVGLAGYMINGWSNYWTNNRSFSNLNAITTNTSYRFDIYAGHTGSEYRHGSYNSAKIYAIDAVITDITFADSTYWNLTGTQPIFKTVPVEIDYTDAIEVYSSVVNGVPVANNVEMAISAETILTVKVGGNVVDYTFNAGILSFNAQCLAPYTGSSVALSIETAETVYTYNLLNVVNKIIETKEDLENMMIYGGLTTKDNGVMVYGGKFVLGNNIYVNGLLNNRVEDVDYNGPVGGSYHYNSDRVVDTTTYDSEIGFTGVFDGQGYSIIGLQIEGGNGGIFGNVARTGVVKNLGVEVIYLQNKATKAQGPFGDRMNGTMTNVYIEGKAGSGSTSATYSGIARNIAHAVLTDVVVKFDTTGLVATNSLGVAYMVNDWTTSGVNKSQPTNVYVITNAAKAGDYGASVTYTMYAIDATVSATFTDNSMWDLTGTQPKFKTTITDFTDVAYDNQVEVYSQVVDGAPVGATLELSVDAASVNDVYVAGTSVDYTFASGTLSFTVEALAPYAGSNASIIVETDSIVYNYKLSNIVTKVIKTQADLENMMIYGGIDANLNYGGYFALGCNIAVSGVLANRVSGVNYTDGVPSAPAMNKGFTGTFDGQGYTISGVVVGKQSGAIFGNVASSGVVKNVAIIATMTQVNENAQVVVLANEFSGALTNAYIEVDFAAGSGAAWYSPVAGQSTASKYTDVVVKVDNTNMSGGNLGAFGFMVNKWTAYWENVMSANNVYVFSTKADITLGAYAATKSDGTYYVGSLNNVSINAYDAVVEATFADATYWDLTGTQPVFATAKGGN